MGTHPIFESDFDCLTAVVEMRFSSRLLRPLLGKTALVTASSDGIGLAIARRLGEDGAKVWISSRRENNVADAVTNLQSEGLAVNGLVCHVGKEQDRLNMIQAIDAEDGKLDILVSNAAVNPYFGTLLDCPLDAWDKIFDINVKTAFQLIRESLPLMEKSGEKSNITCVASIAGYQAMQGLGAYSVSKTALIGLARALVPELTQRVIRINTVCPGVVRTKFASAIVAMEDELADMVSAMGRFATPDEISGIVAFLANEERASYITGENMVVAGGFNGRF